MNLAYAEMKLIVARLLWRFESTLMDDSFLCTAMEGMADC